VRRLIEAGYERVLRRTRAELDLTEESGVRSFFQSEKPDYVFLAAAKVGGILSNHQDPADFIRENLLIQTHVIDAAYKSGVKKLLFLGSSCVYPKRASQPISENELLAGPLESTNRAYAIAKIAGLEMVRAYRVQYGFSVISLMPSNLYGPEDNFDLQGSHVLPALIRKFHEAKRNGHAQVTVWGSGTPRREFLHVDDLADASVFMMKRYDAEEILNIGCGNDLTIADLARLVQQVVGHEGQIVYDRSKPDGTPRKLLDVSKSTALGWRPRIDLRAGIRETYNWFLENLTGRRSS
jgi:GDP-L-fucose synthase